MLGYMALGAGLLLAGCGMNSRGERMKRISMEARKDLEQLLGAPVYLEVWVRVKKGWADDDASLTRLGY